MRGRHLLVMGIVLLAACKDGPETLPLPPAAPPPTGPAAAAAPDAAPPAAAEPAPAADAQAPPAAEPSPGGEAPSEAADAAAPAEPEAPAAGAAPGGALRLSPPELDAHRPRWSPDGRRVAFFAGPPGAADVYVVDADGGGLRKLTQDPADDRDPAWLPGTPRLVFSSNRGGSYDLWVLDVDGGKLPARLTSDPGHEREPTASPLTYRFLAVFADGCSDGGADAQEVARYEKVVYTAEEPDGTLAVRFTSTDGKHTGRLSRVGEDCHGARFAADGLSLAWTCGREGAARVAHDTRARWDQSFAAALEAIGWKGFDQRKGPTGCEADDPASWQSDACLAKLPRRYAVHDEARVPGDGVTALGYSANRTLLLGAGAEGLATRERRPDAAWAAFEGAPPAGVVAADWAPDGAHVAVERRGADGRGVIEAAETAYYLQDVRDLADYPELWGRGRSERLAANRFVAREGTEKEMFTAYEKVAYARRAPYVTADAVLQALHDELTALLKAAEGDAAEALRRLSGALMTRFAERAAAPSERYLAVQHGVMWAFLEAAEAVKTAEDDGEMWDPDAKAPPPPVEQIRAALPKVLAEVPAAIREDVRRLAEAALAHEGFVELPVPGREAPARIDFSQMKVRGHYTTSKLAGYFLAMKWAAMVPLPLDASAAALVQALDAPVPGGDGETGLVLWQRVDGLVGTFMGRPVDATVVHLREVMAEKPALFHPFDERRVEAALREKLGPLPVRGLEGATGAGERPVSLMLFPLRLGLDTTAFTALTHPAVELRGMPSAVDVMAALGVPAAARVAEQREEGQPWFDAYRAALITLRADVPAPGDALWSTDLYHGWLALLRAVATPAPRPPEARMPWTRTEAWADRLLSTALAGYAQLKHDAVLYAFQDFSAECDSERPVLAFVEQPVLPEPRGFVEPRPEVFRAAAALAGRMYAALAPAGQEPGVDLVPWDDDETLWNTKKVAERLARMADDEVAGRPLGEEDLAWLREIGGLLEALFFQQRPTTAAGYGADAGRMARGVALVTDLHTNVTRMEALTVGIGRLDRLYVAVPDTIGSRLTEGAIFSFYELVAPLADRLTDEQWGDRLAEGKAPPRPPWVRSFLEPAAGAAPAAAPAP